MQDTNIINFIKKEFTKRPVLMVFLCSFISLLVILGVAAGTLWQFRGDVFEYFAKEYLRESQAPAEGGVTERIIEKQSTIFTQDSFVIDAVKKTNPAVVSIVISKLVPKFEAYVDPNQNNNPFGDLFPGFNFNVPQYRQNGTESKQVGGGSGFFVSSDGLIVTNKHVVEDREAQYTVFTNDGKKHSARVVARDAVLDIALIKIDGIGYPLLDLGNSDTLQVGQSVIAIGNALAEFKNTVSVGVISGLSRSVTATGALGFSEVLDHVIQTDAAINPGNSGGPLLNLQGKVIGVNVAMAQGSQNIGFALPINSVKSVIDSVKTTGKIIRPFLGVRFSAINAEMKAVNNLSVDYGVLIKRGVNANEVAVIPGSPADKAGLVENDIILEVDGVKLSEGVSLASLIRDKKVGQVVTLKILHKGEPKTVKVTLEEAKDN